MLVALSLCWYLNCTVAVFVGGLLFRLIALFVIFYVRLLTFAVV